MNTFNFSPATGLLDTSAYPTQPTTEAAARQQFMDLFNQIKTFVNADVKNELALKAEKAADFQNSLVNNGYYKLPNGLILQWGQVSASSGTLKTITFNIPFPTAILYVNANIENLSPIAVSVANLSLTQFSAIHNSGSASNMHWFALGN